MRPSRRGPESIRESLSTGSLAPLGLASRGVAQVGKGGRVVCAVEALWKRSRMEVSTTHSHPNRSEWPINAWSAFNRGFPDSEMALRRIFGIPYRDRRASASLRIGTTGTPQPRVVSASYRLGQTFHRLPNPRRLHQFAIFPDCGQMDTLEKTAPGGTAAGCAVESNTATATAGASLRAPHSRPGGLLRLPGFPPRADCPIATHSK